jgi:hypothetical protein
MGLDCAPSHMELAGNFSVVTSLQEQFDDLLLARTQPNLGLPGHRISPIPKPGSRVS